MCVCVCVRPTLIEPVGQAVEDHPVLPGVDQADGAAPHRGAVVDVVLEDEDLHGNTGTHNQSTSFSVTLGVTMAMTLALGRNGCGK